jgi:hypothetical protein
MPHPDAYKDKLLVEVDLLNDAGDALTITGAGFTTDEAVADAEREASRRTGDESYSMTEWRAV